MNDICQRVSSAMNVKEIAPKSCLEHNSNNMECDSSNRITSSYCNFQQYGNGPTLYDYDDVYKNGCGEFWDGDKLQSSHSQSPTCEIILERPEYKSNSLTDLKEEKKMECETAESANASQPNSDRSTPTYLKWAINLKNLLKDPEGAPLFGIYLKQENCERLLEFWFACEGLKTFKSSENVQISQLNRTIYKRYIKQTLKGIKPETKKKIEEKINNKTGVLDHTIYETAQKEVEDIMASTVYPNFLESEVYLQHIRCNQNNASNDSLQNSRSCSSSGSKEGLDKLHTVHEDIELNTERIKERIPFTNELFRQKNIYRISKSKLHGEYHQNRLICTSQRPPASYHAKYASFLPTSAQDSELQSLSSDAQTDDTSSLADSTIDYTPIYKNKSYCKKTQHAMRTNANLNKDHLPYQPFIPRTHRLPKNEVTPDNPKKFANELIEKLNELKKEREIREKVKETINQLDIDDKRTSKTCDNTNRCGTIDPFAALPPQLLTAVIQEKQSFTDESNQAILENHMSRVWKDSATPNKSPAPLSPTPDGYRPYFTSNPLVASSSQIKSNKILMLGGLQNNYQPSKTSPYNTHSASVNANKHRKERDTYSSDSGTVHDFTPENEPASYSSQPLHIHKHVHHYTTNIYSPNLMSSDQGIRTNERRYKETSRRSNSKKECTDSSSSCFDSGVSVACEPLPITDPKERICNWIGSLNEKYSHATSSNTSKSSHTKKQLAYSSSRSGPLETGGTTQWPTVSNNQTCVPASSHIHSHFQSCPPVASFVPLPHAHGIQPGQPFAQDPSMPILPQPDTTTQLVEARRRLEDEARSKPIKGRTNSFGREKLYIDNAKYRPGKTIEQLDDISSHRKQSKKATSISGANSVITNSTNSDVTVIGYCFSGESVPYRTKLPGKNITLKQFKSLLSKKGNYRYFFKKASNEFGTGVINEEVIDDNEVLPLWEEKIFAIIQSVE